MEKQKFDFEQFDDDIRCVVRAMDNVVDRTSYPLEEQKLEATSKRRMGLGVTGLANAGEMLGRSYASDDFMEFMEDVPASCVTQHMTHRLTLQGERAISALEPRQIWTK